MNHKIFITLPSKIFKSFQHDIIILIIKKYNFNLIQKNLIIFHNEIKRNILRTPNIIFNMT